MKGELKIPLARLQESPVYELAFQPGAQMDVLLPRGNTEEEAGNGDIVVGEDDSAGKLSLHECETFEKEGKKMAQVKISLDLESLFELAEFQILNDRNEVLETTCRWWEGWAGGFFLSSYSKRVLEFEAPEYIRKLRIRLLYRVRQKTVTVPVRGEIREEPEKGKGALLR